MKVKLWIALILTVILITGGILQEIYISRVFTDFSEKLEEYRTVNTDDFDEGRLQEIYDWWEGKHKYLEAFVPHTQLNEVEMIYGELIGSVKIGDHDNAASLFERLTYTVKMLDEMFSCRVGNVF